MQFTAQTDLPPITQGDDVTIGLRFTNTETGEGGDIRRWVLWLTVKDDPRDSDADAAFQQRVDAHEAPLDGRSSVTFPSEVTADLSGTKHYDIQVQNRQGVTRTFMKGSVYFGWQATQATG